MDSLFKEFHLTFTKQELIAIANNLLVVQTPQGNQPRVYTPAEGHIIHTLLEKVRPLVDDAKPEASEEKPVDPLAAEPTVIGTNADGQEDKSN